MSALAIEKYRKYNAFNYFNIGTAPILTSQNIVIFTATQDCYLTDFEIKLEVHGWLQNVCYTLSNYILGLVIQKEGAGTPLLNINTTNVALTSINATCDTYSLNTEDIVWIKSGSVLCNSYSNFNANATDVHHDEICAEAAPVILHVNDNLVLSLSKANMFSFFSASAPKDAVEIYLNGAVNFGITTV